MGSNIFYVELITGEIDNIQYAGTLSELRSELFEVYHANLGYITLCDYHGHDIIYMINAIVKISKS